MPDARALAGLARRPCFDRAVLFRRPRRRARLQWCQMPILPLLPGCQAVWGYFIAGFRRGFQKLGAPCSYEGQLMTVALLQNQQQALGRERMTSVQLQSKGHRIPRISVEKCGQAQVSSSYGAPDGQVSVLVMACWARSHLI